MAAGVLNSRQAIELSIYLVRAFVALRESAAQKDELRLRLEELERRIEGKLANQDRVITEILAAIRALMDQPLRPTRPIGFVTPSE